MIEIDTVLYDLRAANWKQTYHKVADHIADDINQDADDLAAALIYSEHKSPSGVGQNVALPHLLVEGLSDPYIAFVKLSSSVEMETMDALPVDTMMILLSPANDGPYHLQRLSRISRLFKNESFSRKIRSAESEDAVHAIVMDGFQTLFDTIHQETA